MACGKMKILAKVKKAIDLLRDVELAMRGKKLANQEVREAVFDEESVGKASIWIGDDYVEGIDATELSDDTFVEETGFTGVLISETRYKSKFNIFYCVKGKVVREERVEAYDVKRIVGTAKDNKDKIYVGKWWIAIENERLAAIGGI